MSVWDETDIMAVLEVIPEVESDGIWHQYIIEKDGIQLKIIVYQYDGDVRFELINTNNSSNLFSMQLMNCEGVRRVVDKTGEYLEFAPAKCFGTRYDGEESIPFGVRVRAKPSISLSLYG
ncbi:hypothetical protein [Vibrio nigripulchritudo]|uniref:hypothetical protein n=1 Tax=Vibrio nigripulchritudo TaxID=28173 RepID=UPI0003B22238|nr:hypothetical protein [Vibrio nigripulchritudo]CCN71509.1 Ypar14 [Vibrio nigripulchritudo SFn118]